MNMSEKEKITLIAQEISRKYTDDVRDEVRSSIVSIEGKIDNIFPMLKEFMSDFLQPQLVNLKQEVFSRISETDHKFDKRIDNINTHRDGIYRRLESEQLNCKASHERRIESVEERLKRQDIEFEKFGELIYSTQGGVKATRFIFGAIAAIITLFFGYLQIA